MIFLFQNGMERKPTNLQLNKHNYPRDHIVNPYFVGKVVSFVWNIGSTTPFNYEIFREKDPVVTLEDSMWRDEDVDNSDLVELMEGEIDDVIKARQIYEKLTKEQKNDFIEFWISARQYIWYR